MSIRKRSWTKASGERREAWQVDFVDQAGNRQRKQFDRKRDADAWLLEARGHVTRGTFTPDSSSATIGEAIDLWFERGEAEGLERSTLRQYRQHKVHILAAIDGSTKLSRLSKPRVEQLRDQLVKDHSRPMARKLLQSFRSIISDASRRGLIAHDVAAGTTIARAKRHDKRLEVGVDVPTPLEVKAMIDAAADEPKALAFVCLAALAGLRASELRGLSWANVKLGTDPNVTITTRADRWSTLGSPKSESSQRKVPVGAVTVRALKAWKLAQPAGRALVFGTAKNRPDQLANLHRRLLAPLQDRAKVRRYSPHSLRHYAISSWLASSIDPKTVQNWAGHATLALTLDTYGHMIPRPDDHARIAVAESTLLGT